MRKKLLKGPWGVSSGPGILQMGHPQPLTQTFSARVWVEGSRLPGLTLLLRKKVPHGSWVPQGQSEATYLQRVCCSPFWKHQCSLPVSIPVKLHYAKAAAPEGSLCWCTNADPEDEALAEPHLQLNCSRQAVGCGRDGDSLLLLSSGNHLKTTCKIKPSISCPK